MELRPLPHYRLALGARWAQLHAGLSRAVGDPRAVVVAPDGEGGLHVARVEPDALAAYLRAAARRDA